MRQQTHTSSSHTANGRLALRRLQGVLGGRPSQKDRCSGGPSSHGLSLECPSVYALFCPPLY